MQRCFECFQGWFFDVGGDFKVYSTFGNNEANDFILDDMDFANVRRSSIFLDKEKEAL